MKMYQMALITAQILAFIYFTYIVVDQLNTTDQDRATRKSIQGGWCDLSLPYSIYRIKYYKFLKYFCSVGLIKIISASLLFCHVQWLNKINTCTPHVGFPCFTWTFLWT